MEKNFIDGYLSCKAEEFLQILEQNDFNLHDTSTTSNRIKMNIVVAGEVYLPTNLDKAMCLEDIIFLDDLVIEETIFQQDITLRRCSFKSKINIGGKYSSYDCFLDGLKVGRIPLVES